MGSDSAKEKLEIVGTVVVILRWYIVSEGISGGMVVVESVLAIVRVFGSHPVKK